MAKYFLDKDGKLTKKSKGKRYILGEDGNLTLDKPDAQNMTVTSSKEEEEDTWFKSGAFGDDEGNWFTDTIDTFNDTMMDVNTGILKGLGGMAEGLADLGMYAVSGVSDFFGADEFAKDVKDIATKNAVKAADDKIKEVYNYEENSVLGNKSDNISQGLGQVAGLLLTRGIGAAAGLGTGATTALTTGTTFLSSAGSGMSEAYQGGAEDKEAVTYGALKGGIDAGTELLFGGLGKGLNATGLSRGLGGLDDKLADFATKKITNQVLKNTAKYGIKASGEGLEEVLAGVGTAFAKQATYMSEEDIETLLNDENLLDQFITGSIVGGMASAPSLVKSNVSGRDYTTGLTVNEQKVVDKEVENRITEMEADGTKLSNKEKSSVAEQVQKDLERGYISIDTIESTLGGDTYNSYQSAVDTESKLQEEIKTLEDMPNSQITVKQNERLQGARKELEALQKKDEKTSLRAKLNDEITNMTAKDTYLRESYNEKARRSQKFEADVSKYNEKQAAVIQKAIDSGILNNTNRTHEFVDMIAKISADKGVSFDFADNQKLKDSGFALDGKTVNGYVQGSNITINVNSAKAWNKVVGHEITHVLEGTELYTELQEMVIEYAKIKGEYQSRYDALANLYKDVENTNIDNELTADLVGDYLFTDEDFINNLSTEKPGIFKRIYNEIKYLLKVATAGSKEAKQLEKVKKTFDKVYKESTDTQSDSNTKYSLIGTDEDGIEVYETSDSVKKLSYSERNKLLLKSVLENYKGRTAKFTKNGVTYYALYNEQGVRKGVYGDKKSDTNGRKAKTNIGADGNYIELAENALYTGTSNEQGKVTNSGFHTDAKTWDYYEKTIKSDGKYYDVLINVKDTGSKQYVYDITLKEASLPHRTNLYSRGKLASNDIIPSPEENTSGVEQFSLSSDKDSAPIGSYNVYGKDLLYEALEEISGLKNDIIELKDALEAANSNESKLATSQEKEQEAAVDYSPNPDNFGKSIKTVQDREAAKLENYKVELSSKTKQKENSYRQYNRDIAEKEEYLRMEKNKNSEDANTLKSQIAELKTERDNVQATLEKDINTLKERIKKMSTPEYKRTVQRQQKQQDIRTELSKIMGDTATWKDRTSGMGYKLHTLKRNLRDVVRDENGNKDITKADAIYRALQGNYNHNEAQLNKEANSIKKAYADKNINKFEDQYIQMLGEYRHNPDTTLTADVVKDFYEKHKNKIDTAKVDRVIDMARDTYDDLFTRVNEVLREYGIKEIPYREGYFPHFTNESQGLLAKILNWKKEDNSIPTDIAGITEHFKPNKSYQSFSQKRTGDTTDYSFLKGLDTYTFGALDWIHHIGDIQRFRAFENEIRYRHSDEGVKEKIKNIEANELYDADEAQAQIDAVYAEKKNPLNQLVQNIRTHTNLLAGKKNTMDRAIEEDFNRNIYSIVKNGSSRINANMVGGSVSSALTNFIPITQSWSQVSPVSSLKAMRDTIKSTMLDDGKIGKSDFLTNRLRKADKLSKSTWDKVSDKISIMMEAVDSFTSQTVWRSKYMENISQGMTETEAIRNADEFAEGVIAGRSRGNMPVVFESKNPLTKIFTAFQLEVANQYDYMLKDMPTDIKNKTTSNLVKAYGAMFLGAYAYNALYSSLTGRDAAFDPIGIIQDILKDLFDDEEDEPEDIIFNIIDSVGDEVPYLGGVLFDGGRVPLSSALPYGEGLIETVKGTVEDVSNKNWESLKSEWLNPVYYLALPAGGGQLKKTMDGLSMYDDNPVAGSYTSSGNLRFAVEDDWVSKLQALVFGQWANENARQYIEEGRQTLKSKQIEEFAALDMSMKEYWDYRDGLKEQNTLEEKFDYIAGLDASVEQKNIMINNVVDRKEKVDLSNYNDFSSYAEFDFATKNPEEYKVSQVIGDYKTYAEYSKDLNEITADKDEDGESISGSRKDKVINYINNLDADYGAKIILYKSEYPSDDTYNMDIIDYLNDREDIGYQEMEDILKALGFTVEEDGTVRWD